MGCTSLKGTVKAKCTEIFRAYKLGLSEQRHFGALNLR